MYALRSYLGAWDRGAMPPSMAIRPSHRRRSGWNSGGRMASAEGASVLSGVRYGEGCPIPGRLGGVGERREAGRKRILAYF